MHRTSHTQARRCIRINRKFISFLVLGGEALLGLHGRDRGHELAHLVQLARHLGQHMRCVPGQRSPFGPLTRNVLHLLRRRYHSCKHEKEESFGQGLRATGRFGEQLLQLGNAVASKANTLGVQQRGQ